jgi:hypothetical protein
MNSKTLIFSVVLASGGCASANPADTAPSDIGAEWAVEMIVVNRTSRTVTAFAEWRNGARIRIGEVSQRETISFTTPCASHLYGCPEEVSRRRSRPSPSEDATLAASHAKHASCRPCLTVPSRAPSMSDRSLQRSVHV